MPMTGSTITIGDSDYILASEDSRILTEYIHKVWEKAGKPDRLETESAWKVMDALFKVWSKFYPHELDAWIANLKDEQSVERSVHEANKSNGGYFPIAYPTRLFNLISVYFKDAFTDRKLTNKMIKRYPVLKITKHSIA